MNIGLPPCSPKFRSVRELVRASPKVAPYTFVSGVKDVLAVVVYIIDETGADRKLLVESIAKGASISMEVLQRF